MKVELRKITSDNYDECTMLSTTREQREMGLTLSVKDALSEAQRLPRVARPFAIYLENQLIGFTMFAFDESIPDPCDRYWLWQFMIDHRYQGKGYGNLVLPTILNYFRMHGIPEITLSTKPENAAALHLYYKFGFRKNGKKNGEEVILKLRL